MLAQYAVKGPRAGTRLAGTRDKATGGDGKRETPREIPGGKNFS